MGFDETAILIADRDAQERVRLESILSAEGMFILTARDRMDLFAKVARVVPLGLLFLDTDFDTWPIEEIIGMIKRLNPWVPVVITVGNNNPRLEERVRQAGIFYYILKPVAPLEVRAVVRSARRLSYSANRRHPDSVVFQEAQAWKT